VIFKEVLRPPIWVLAFIYFLLLSLVIAIWAAFSPRATFFTFLVATIAIIYLAFAMRSTITISDSESDRELRVGRAHIARNFIGKVTVVDSQTMRLLRTRDADPAAYLAIKFWASTGVKIEITDPQDPTPYWLITSKRGEEIAALLNNS
jgi:hypothetical protein